MTDDAKRRLVGGIILAAILIMIAMLISDGEQPQEAQPSTLQLQLDAARESGNEAESVQTLNLEMPPPREAEQDSVRIDLPPEEPIAEPEPLTTTQRRSSPIPRPAAEPARAEPEPEPAPRPAARPAPAPQPVAKPAPRPAPPSPPPPQAADGDWAVQVGSFSDQGNASRLRADLQAKGYPAYVRPAVVNGSQVHRVRVGPFRTEVGAQQLAARLSSELGQPVKVLHDR